MKIRYVIILALASLFAAGCATEGKPKANNANTKVYFADLNGNGQKEIIETEDRSSVDSTFEVRVKNNDKTANTIDGFSLPGKVKSVEFPDLNLDGRHWPVVYFEGKDNKPSIAVYKLNNDKLSKIFFATSEYGIEADFDSTARIKIGKARRSTKSPNLVSDWDNWVWTGEKFVPE
ncbi:MAG: hypothetical protein PHN57_07590 [Candidatus Omnitrophica bacterium]|nr:hypothetical protein [Candidatus Omnitrophota bacterium]